MELVRLLPLHRRHRRGEDVLGGVARLHPFEVPGRADQQRRTAEKRDGQHDLERGDGAERAALAAAGRRARAVQPLQAIGERGTGGGKQAGNRRGDDGGGETEGKDGPADVHGIGARHRLPGDGLEQPHDADGECGTEEAAGDSQHETFGQRLAEQAPPARPERGAHGVLGVTLQAARQQQPRHVGAGDQEDDRDRAEERNQQPPAVAVEDVLHARDPRRDPLQRRLGLRHASGNRGDLGLRLIDRRAVPQPRDHVAGAERQARLVGRGAEPEIDRRVDVVVRFRRGRGIREEPDPRRHDADDRQRRRHPAHTKGLADDARIAVELALPEIVADDDGRRRHVRPAELGVRELAPEDRTDAEDLEVIGRHDHAAHRAAAVGQDQEVERPAVDGGRFDRLRLAPRVPLPDGRAAVVGAAIETRRRDEHQTSRIGERRRRQEHALDERENGRGGADAEAERDDRNRGKPRVLAQLPEGKADIIGHGASLWAEGGRRRGSRWRIRR